MATSTRTRSGACRVELLVGQVDDILDRLDPLQLVLGDLEVHLLLEADREVDEIEAVELQVVDQARGGDDLLVPQLEALDEQVAQSLEDLVLGHLGLIHVCPSSSLPCRSYSACR